MFAPRDPLRNTLDQLALDPRAEADRKYLVSMLRRLGYSEQEIAQALGEVSPRNDPIELEFQPSRKAASTGAGFAVVEETAPVFRIPAERTFTQRDPDSAFDAVQETTLQPSVGFSVARGRVSSSNGDPALEFGWQEVSADVDESAEDAGGAWAGASGADGWEEPGTDDWVGGSADGEATTEDWSAEPAEANATEPWPETTAEPVAEPETDVEAEWPTDEPLDAPTNHAERQGDPEQEWVPAANDTAALDAHDATYETPDEYAVKDAPADAWAPAAEPEWPEEAPSESLATGDPWAPAESDDTWTDATDAPWDEAPATGSGLSDDWVEPTPSTDNAWAPKTDAAPVTSGYTYGHFALYTREVELSTGKTQRIYFFSKTAPGNGEACNLPDGYLVEENERTRLPFLRRDSTMPLAAPVAKAPAKKAAKAPVKKAAKAPTAAKATAKPVKAAKPAAKPAQANAMCGAITAQAKPCSRHSRDNSKYCGLHKNYPAPRKS